MSKLNLLGEKTLSNNIKETKYLKLKQNKDIIQLIKLIINPSSELDTTSNSYINVWTDENENPIGTCYTGKNGLLLYVKGFVATNEQLFPKITDRHLKLLIHLLSQDENILTFSNAKFNRDCSLKKSSITGKRNYHLLEDLLKYHIVYTKSGQQIKYSNTKNYNEYKNEITLNPVFILKSLNYNIAEKATNSDNGLIIKHTEVTTKLSRAKIELCDILTSKNRGLMYYHKDILKIKQNPKTKLGSVSIAFNIYYLQSVNSKKKQDNKVIYNVSTVLGWIGIYEGKYMHFFKTNKKRGITYIINQLNTYFKELDGLGIHSKFINIERDISRFYNKTQIEFDITDLKNNFN